MRIDEFDTRDLTRILLVCKKFTGIVVYIQEIDLETYRQIIVEYAKEMYFDKTNEETKYCLGKPDSFIFTYRDNNSFETYMEIVNKFSSDVFKNITWLEYWRNGEVYYIGSKESNLQLSKKFYGENA